MLEILDINPNSDPELASIDAFILNCRFVEHLTLYLDNPALTLEKLPTLHF